MSVSTKLAIGCAVLFSGAMLVNGVYSRQQLDQVAEMKPLTPEPKSAKADPYALASGRKTAEEVKRYLETRLPGMEISAIEPSPIKGFYQLFAGGDLLYVSDNGEYIFTGKLIELANGNPVDHSQQALNAFEESMAPARAEKIAAIDEADMVVFKAANEKHRLTVFTDVDCTYCRKLHTEVPELNDLGITVRYLAYPRAGIGSDSYHKLVSVWCADDRLQAMNDAKLQRKFGNASCENPIANQFNLTREFNLSGTPTLIFPNGKMIASYIPAKDLLAVMEQMADEQNVTQKQVAQNPQATSAAAY